MTYRMTVSPDFTPDYIAGWYIFNTWLQKQLGEKIHLELHNDFSSQREAIRNNQIDIIYANPFDASVLVREKGFTALARPAEKSDEAMVVVNAQYPANCIEDLEADLRLVSTDDPDVHLMGMIMLEPADLSVDSAQIHRADSYVIVAKQLLRHEADVGFFLKDAYNGLAKSTRSQLKVLVTSQISVIYHTLLVGPRLAHRQALIRKMLVHMLKAPKGPDVLASLGFKAWKNVTQEDVEFMIDLMDTLS